MQQHQLTEEDRDFIRIIRSQLGEEWSVARERILARLPDHLDPDLLGKYVDERAEPGIHINKWGVEPRFYPHRASKRLLEFYQIRTPRD
ncbi:hypothetical protein GGR26_000124 [Lewinella marina]|uniref:Uncharacterized protein n=1 Tax=Neolewinella marina TaxID=438751 RepID=A0A2G0CKD5_9BACT|nr:hypothetical protein [Neolewinella marina]NJB84379.1 hypothetical protein [Neolewinella marina]PHL00425.1 hypothetical protein CGL56_05165 [Neolewinella marina]